LTQKTASFSVVVGRPGLKECGRWQGSELFIIAALQSPPLLGRIKGIIQD